MFALVLIATALVSESGLCGTVNTGEEQAEKLERKLRLTASLLGGEHTTELEAARQAILEGRLAEADRLLNTLLTEGGVVVETESQDQRLARKKAELDQSWTAVQSLRASLNELAEERGLSERAMLEQAKLEMRYRQVQQRIEAGDLVDAPARAVELADEYGRLLSSLRANETIVYELHFDGPKDEYLYEKRRYQGYLLLLQSYQLEVTADHETDGKLRDVLENAAALDAAAETALLEDRPEEALQRQEQANRVLARGLRAAGVFVME